MKVRGSFWVKAFVVLVLALGGAGYALLYSSVPIQLLSKLLAESGIELTGISGSVTGGISIEHFKVKTVGMELDIQGGRYRFTGLTQYLGDRRVVIQSIEAEKASLTLAKVSDTQFPRISVLSSAPSPSSPADAPLAQVFESEQNPKGIREFKIEQIRFQHATIKTPKVATPLEFHGIEAKNLVMTAQATTLESLNSDGGPITIKLKGFKSEGEKVSIEPSWGSVKTAFQKETLIKDVTFGISGAWGKNLAYELKLFDDHVTLQTRPDHTWAVTVKNFTPSEYFKTEFPVHDMNFFTETKAADQTWTAISSISGGYLIGENHFGFYQVQPPGTPAGVYYSENRNPKDKSFTTFLYRISLSPVISEWKFGFEIESSKKLSHKDALATLLFGKTSGSLNDEQKSKIEAVSSVITALNPQPQTDRAPAAAAAEPHAPMPVTR